MKAPIMCGRFANFQPPDAIRRLFRTANPTPNFQPSWNIAPSQEAPVVRVNPETHERSLDLLTWGLVPHWTKDLKTARKPINARAETVATSPLFRAAYVARRCIIPADAFYEWRQGGEGEPKQPFAIARQDGKPLAFAGLWEGWKASGTGKIIRSFAIITTDANIEMSTIHDRMPAVIEESSWHVWLGEEGGDPAELLRPAKAGLLNIWPVSMSVNSPRNNGPELLERIA